jgi:ABC-type Fe3+-hydroxamate transport system substrate-binding protein
MLCKANFVKCIEECCNLLQQAQSWAQSYQQKFYDVRNFQKKSENFKPTIFVGKVRKITNLMFWFGLFTRSPKMFFKTVLYEHN